MAAVAEPAFQARPPWLGGDLQTLRNLIVGARADLSAWPAERLGLEMADGSGDRLMAALHRGEASRPLAILIHGLTGCEDSRYLRATARHLLGRGQGVLRLNLRGAGPSGPHSRQAYHAGRSSDLRAALECLEPALRAGGVQLVGFSLGANMLLKFLAEEGAAAARRYGIRAAAVVSAPMDLKAAQVRLMARRNRVYHRYLLNRMKAEALAGAAPWTARERTEIRAIASVYDFDDAIVAPRNGFAGAEDYYRRSSAAPLLAEIRVPTLMIHALDDPWIPPKAYLQHPWSETPALRPLLPAGGGHVGFHARGSTTPWHDRAIGRFFAEAG